jgi:hypothetical protein
MRTLLRGANSKPSPAEWLSVIGPILPLRHVATRLYMPAKLQECRDSRPFLSITPCHPAPAQGKSRFLHDVPSKSITLVYRPRAFGRSSLPIKAGQFTLHVVTCSFLPYVVINVIISFLSSLSLVRNHGHQLRNHTSHSLCSSVSENTHSPSSVLTWATHKFHISIFDNSTFATRCA